MTTNLVDVHDDVKNAMQSYLEIKKPNSVSWNQRYLVVMGKSLFYFHQRGDAMPTKVYPLLALKASPCPHNANVFFIYDHNELLMKARAHSKTERDEWVTGLRAAINRSLGTAQPTPGTLILTIIGARGLQERNGKPSPYAILTTGSVVIKTEPIENTENPMWNQRQKLNVANVNDSNETILIQVWSKGKSFGKSKEFLGQSRINIVELLQTEELNSDEQIMKNLSTVVLAGIHEEAPNVPAYQGKWLKLRRRAQEEHVSGEVCLRAEFRSSSVPTTMNIAAVAPNSQSVPVSFDHFLPSKHDDIPVFTSHIGSTIEEKIDATNFATVNAKTYTSRIVPIVIDMNCIFKLPGLEIPSNILDVLPTDHAKDAFNAALLCVMTPLLTNKDIDDLNITALAQICHNENFEPITADEAAFHTLEALRTRWALNENGIFPSAATSGDLKVQADRENLVTQISKFADVYRNGVVGMLNIKVLSASDLPKSLLLEAFVEMSIGNRILGATDSIMNATAPEWNKDFELELLSGDISQEAKLRFTVMDKKRLGDNNVIGHVELGLMRIFSMQGNTGVQNMELIASEYTVAKYPQCQPSIKVEAYFTPINEANVDQEGSNPWVIYPSLWEESTSIVIFNDLLNAIIRNKDFRSSDSPLCLSKSAISLLDEYAERWAVGRVYGRLKYLEFLGILIEKNLPVPPKHVSIRLLRLDHALKTAKNAMSDTERDMLQHLRVVLANWCKSLLLKYHEYRGAFTDVIVVARWAQQDDEQITISLLDAAQKKFQAEVSKMQLSNKGNAYRLLDFINAIGAEMQADIEHVIPEFSNAVQILELQYEMLSKECIKFFQNGLWTDLDCRVFFELFHQVRLLMRSQNQFDDFSEDFQVAVSGFIRNFVNKITVALCQSAAEALQVDDFNPDVEYDGHHISSSVTDFFKFVNEALVMLRDLHAPCTTMQAWSSELIVNAVSRFISDFLRRCVEDTDNRGGSINKLLSSEAIVCFNNFDRACDCVPLLEGFVIENFVVDGDELHEEVKESLVETKKKITEAMQIFALKFWDAISLLEFPNRVRSIAVSAPEHVVPGWIAFFDQINDLLGNIRNDMGDGAQDVFFPSGFTVFQSYMDRMVVSQNSSAKLLYATGQLTDPQIIQKISNLYTVEIAEVQLRLDQFPRLDRVARLSIPNLEAIWQKKCKEASNPFADTKTSDIDSTSASQIASIIALRKNESEEARKVVLKVRVKECFGLNDMEEIYLKLQCRDEMLLPVTVYVTSLHVCIFNIYQPAKHFRLPLSEIESVSSHSKAYKGETAFWGWLLLNHLHGQCYMYHIDSKLAQVVIDQLMTSAQALPGSHIIQSTPPSKFILQIKVLIVTLTAPTPFAGKVSVVARVGEKHESTTKLELAERLKFLQRLHLNVADANSPLVIRVLLSNRLQDVVLGGCQIERINRWGESERGDRMDLTLYNSEQKPIGVIRLFLQKLPGSDNLEDTSAPRVQQQQQLPVPQQQQQNQHQHQHPSKQVKAPAVVQYTEVYENECRYSMLHKFSSKSLQVGIDPPAWSDALYRPDEINISDHNEEWHVDTSCTEDPEGWQYAPEWPLPGRTSGKWRNSTVKWTDMVRRRKWVRGNPPQQLATFNTFVVLSSRGHPKLQRNMSAINEDREEDEYEMVENDNGKQSSSEQQQQQQQRPSSLPQQERPTSLPQQPQRPVSSQERKREKRGMVLKSKSLPFFPKQPREMIVAEGKLFLYKMKPKILIRTVNLNRAYARSMGNEQPGFHLKAGEKNNDFFVQRRADRDEWLSVLEANGCRVDRT